MPEIDSGTIAAAVPIDVPTISRVSGISATSKMMKGNDRKPLTIAPTTLLIHRFSQTPPCAVPTRTRPSGRPTAKLIAPETAVIITVSPSDPRRRSRGRLSMAEDFHFGAAAGEITFDSRDKISGGTADCRAHIVRSAQGLGL